MDHLIHNRLNFTWYADDRFTFRADVRNRLMFGDFVRIDPTFGDQVEADNSDFWDLSHHWIDDKGLLLNSNIDRLYLVSNEFVNTMTQSPTVTQLLPVSSDEEAAAEVPALFDYIYEPEAKPILDTVLKRYIESQIYQAVVENIACEQSARMVAMKAASDNAGDLISELELVYNKARQAAITQEISEIVSGAAAV